MLANKSHLLHSIIVNYTQLEPFTACSLFTVLGLARPSHCQALLSAASTGGKMRLGRKLKGMPLSGAQRPTESFLLPRRQTEAHTCVAIWGCYGSLQCSF